MKKRIVAIILTATLSMATTSEAVWGAVFYATKGASIPHIMHEGQVFEKPEHFWHFKLNGCTIHSDNESVVSVKMLEGKDRGVQLTAHKAGVATVIIRKENGKKHSEYTIKVAYNHLSKVPSNVEVGTKLYIVASPKRSECIITSNHPKILCLRNLHGNKHFYEIRCKHIGEVELKQNNHTKMIRITAQKNKKS